MRLVERVTAAEREEQNSDEKEANLVACALDRMKKSFSTVHVVLARVELYSSGRSDTTYGTHSMHRRDNSTATPPVPECIELLQATDHLVL